MKLQKHLLSIFVFLMISLFIATCDKDSDNVVEPSILTDTVRIGSFIPLSDDGPIDGFAIKEVIDIAVEDINSYFEGQKLSKNLVVEIIDHQYSSGNINTGIDQLKAKGVKITTSANTSDNLSLVTDKIDTSGIVMIDITSTSPALSTDDNLIRFIPDDNYTANVIKSLLNYKGITQLAIVYRNDNWGNNFQAALRSHFEEAGGAVITSLPYDPRIPELDVEDVLSNLNDLINTTSQSDEVAVELICFDEGTLFLNKASDYTSLSAVTWLGSDGFIRNQAVLDDTAAASFALDVGMHCPTIAENSSSKYISIKTQVSNAIGHSAQPFAMIMYDAIWAAALSTVELDADASVYQIKAKISEILGEISTITGAIELNSNGDRISAPYEFLGIIKENSDYKWEITYSYSDYQIKED